DMLSYCYAGNRQERKLMKLRFGLKLPKEHGAWAMVYVPFVLGLLVAGKFNFALPAIAAGHRLAGDRL
ncbi:MAG: YwiC-like family protein, partial [Acidobacteriota bacterium]